MRLPFLALATFVATPAIAQDVYVSGSAGINFQADSDNDGTFNGDFSTGAGTTIPQGTILPDGTPVGWTTEFESGMYGTVAVGLKMGPYRGELEFSGTQNDVDTHTDVEAAGIALGSEDAGVLVSGADNLGVTVSDLVADGRGEISAMYLFANGFYDFEIGGPVKPYLGVGIGIGFVEVDYSPSDVAIIDDDATAFAYQVMAGVTVAASETIDVFGGYRFRGTTDVEVDAELFDATFDIENQANILEVGLRLNF